NAGDDELTLPHAIIFFKKKRITLFALGISKGRTQGVGSQHFGRFIRANIDRDINLRLSIARRTIEKI
ncbi:hypothetical protein ACJX0J_034683, partial [Zea mays]